MTPATPVDPRRALVHPLWWSSLALLVINDHVLKGAGLLPAWLTGKLSDVAGLVMAPALCAALANARTARARTLAMLPVVTLFTAIKLSPTAAHTLANTLTALGLSSRIVADPSDLVALFALPLAWWLVTRPPAPRVLRPHVARLATVLGAVACMATSKHSPRHPTATRAFVVNRLPRQVTLELRWPVGPVDCERLFRNPLTYLQVSTFTPRSERRHLYTDSAEGLVPDHRSSSSPTPTPTPRCEVVLVSAQGLPDTFVYWRDLPTQTIDPSLSPDASALARGLIELLPLRLDEISLTVPHADVSLLPVSRLPH